MKAGKVSETVLKRSILKEIKHKRPEIIQGASLYGGCSAVSCGEDEIIVFTSDTNLYADKYLEELSINTVVNDIITSGAQSLGVFLNMALPESVFESDLKGMMKKYNQASEKRNIQVIGVDVEFTKSVNRPVITVTGIGKVKKDKLLDLKNCKPGNDIVMSKSIGIEGTYLALLEKEEEISKRFSPGFIRKIADYKNDISIEHEAAVATKHGVLAMHNVKLGGIFGALWDLGSATKSGLKVDLKSINVRQETIEICEVLNFNPYRLLSGGSLLMVTEDGKGLVDTLRSEGIISCVIGKITEGNEKVIQNEDELRYLEPSKDDDVYKLF